MEVATVSDDADHESAVGTTGAGAHDTHPKKGPKHAGPDDKAARKAARDAEKNARKAARGEGRRFGPPRGPGKDGAGQTAAVN